MALPAAADPAPRPVDVKALKAAKPIVLQDAQGGVYVVFRGDDSKLFYGPNAKAVYEQIIIGSSSSGDDFDFSTWAPRLGPGVRYGGFAYKDKVYAKTCDGKDDAVLTELTGDKARAILDKTQFLTMAVVHVPHLLARDDSGVYYYVDRIAKIYGGKGYRVFVGKKGAMKQMPLTDVASDSAGDVFSTKSGDLRLVRNSESNKETMTWVRGEKRTELVFLETDVNSAVIFKDLGIYTFLGTLCDNV
ncbi:MAG TPA: hypothetical protein VFK02_19370 [Kofleriaceae bacterium]|nr:hypothetical protein [Kofleriaceae bacterium]